MSSSKYQQYLFQSPATGGVVIVEKLRSRYEALLTTAPEHEGHAGRMLLMGFNGLFAAVEMRARELADHLAIPVPQAWRKIDHISDAMHMSVRMLAVLLKRDQPRDSS